jgi:nucleotide-binding universal stress UspA family protein
MLLNDPDALLADAREHLNRVAGRLRPDAPNVVCRAVLGRPLAATIVRLAGEEHVQMIAMATHGHKGLARLVLGSVATETLRHASTPVLLVRPASLARDQFSRDKRLIDGLAV